MKKKYYRIKSKTNSSPGGRTLGASVPGLAFETKCTKLKVTCIINTSMFDVTIMG